MAALFLFRRAVQSTTHNRTVNKNKCHKWQHRHHSTQHTVGRRCPAIPEYITHLPHEAHAALPALVRLLVAVGEHVGLEVVAPAEGLAADVTAVRLLPGVGSDVLLQMLWIDHL